MLPANLPSIGNVRLPTTYEQANLALAACERIDECSEWANRAEALASYAKMADDDTLRKLADRIQARAVRRMGELLKQFDGKGNNQHKKGDLPTQKEAAEAANISEHQRKQAVRVANVPAAAFNAATEGDKPATVTALAERGLSKKLAVKAKADRAEQTAAAKREAKLKPAIKQTVAEPEPVDNPAKLIEIVEHFGRISVSATVARMSNDDRIAMMTLLGWANAWLNRTAIKVAISGGANLGKLAPLSLRFEARDFLHAAITRIDAELAGRGVATPEASS